MPWPMRYNVRTSSSCPKKPMRKNTLRPANCLWRWRKVVVQGEDEEDDHSRLASQRCVCGGKMTSIVIIPAILWKDPWWSLTSDFQISLSTMWMMAPALGATFSGFLLANDQRGPPLRCHRPTCSTANGQVMKPVLVKLGSFSVKLVLQISITVLQNLSNLPFSHTPYKRRLKTAEWATLVCFGCFGWHNLRMTHNETPMAPMTPRLQVQWWALVWWWRVAAHFTCLESLSHDVLRTMKSQYSGASMFTDF